jgi:hypothetical protein
MRLRHQRAEVPNVVHPVGNLHGPPGPREVDVRAPAIARRQDVLIVDGTSLRRIGRARIAVLEPGFLDEVPSNGSAVALAAQFLGMPGYGEDVPVHRLRRISIRLARDDDLTDRERPFSEPGSVCPFLAEPIADRGVNSEIEVVDADPNGAERVRR